MRLDCPECGRPLLTSLAGGERVDGCHACGGVWFDDGELARLMPTAVALADLERAYLPEADRASLGSGCCPRCAERLAWHSLRQARDVRMRVCGKCRGVWAPEGTLARLAAILPGQPVGALPAADAPAATSVDTGGQAVEVFRRRAHPALELAGKLLGCWLLLWYALPDDLIVPWGLAVSVALALVTPFVAHTVWVDSQGLRLQSLALRWRVPWSSYVWAYVHDPGSTDPAERWGCDADGAPAVAWSDLVVSTTSASTGWGLSPMARIMLLTWRGLYTFGGEWRHHGGLIDAIRRGLGDP